MEPQAASRRMAPQAANRRMAPQAANRRMAPRAASRRSSRLLPRSAAERLPLLLALHPAAELTPAISPPARLARPWTAEEAAVEAVRGRLQAAGPTTAGELAAGAGVRAGAVEAALAALEAEGFAL